MARIIVPRSMLGDAADTMALQAHVNRVAKELQVASDEYYRVNYPQTYERGQADKVTVKPKKKYINIDIGSSGAYMVDTTDGTVYGIKGYGVPHKGVVFGNVADVDGATLLQGRHARSGSIRPAPPRKQPACTFCATGAQHHRRLHNLSIEAKRSGVCYCGDGGVVHCDFCTGTREMPTLDVVRSLKSGQMVAISTRNEDWLGTVTSNVGQVLTLRSLDRSVTKDFLHHDIYEVEVRG